MIVIVNDELSVTYHRICESYVELFFTKLKEEGEDGEWMTVLFFCCKRCEVVALCMEFKEELGPRRFPQKWFSNPTEKLPKMEG